MQRSRVAKPLAELATVVQWLVLATFTCVAAFFVVVHRSVFPAQQIFVDLRARQPSGRPAEGGSVRWLAALVEQASP